MNDKDNNEPVKGQPLTPFDEAVLEFLKRLFIDSINSVNDFAKSMVTIVSGFFIAYFALLNYLGLGEKASTQQNIIGLSNPVVPPILFIVSIIALIFCYMPPVIPKKINIHDVSSIVDLRNSILKVKYIPMCIGGATFLLELGITLQLCIAIIYS